MNVQSKLSHKIFRGVIIFFLILNLLVFDKATIVKANQTWPLNVQINDTVYTIFLNLTPEQIINGPIHQSQLEGILKNVSVYIQGTNQKITDKKLINRVLFLAQNKAISMSDNTDWRNIFSTTLDTKYNPVIENINGSDVVIPIWLSNGITPFYTNILTYGRFGYNLSNINERTKFYKDVLRRMIFPEMNDPEIAELESDFDDTFGVLYSMAVDQATNYLISQHLESDIGTIKWTRLVVKNFREILNSINNSNLPPGVSPKDYFPKISIIMRYTTILDFALSGINEILVFNDIATKAILMHAYMLSIGSERLEALEHLISNQVGYSDPAFSDALYELSNELSEYNDANWQTAFHAYFIDLQQNPYQHIKTFSGILVSISELALPAAASYITVIYLGVKVVFGAVEWLNNRDERMMRSAIAAGIENFIRDNLNYQFIVGFPEDQDFEKWLLLSNMRLQASSIFYDLILQRENDWFEELFQLNQWTSRNEMIEYLSGKRNQAKELFKLTLPRIYWAYSEKDWLEDIVHREYPSPYLSNSEINPTTGTENTNFQFKVKFTDFDNNSPDYVNLLINGNVYNLTSTGTNYDEGVIFTSSLLKFSQGSYSYSFSARPANSDTDISLGTYTLIVGEVIPSSVVISASPSIIDMYQSSTITVQILDLNNQPIIGETIHFSSNGFSGAFTNCSTQQGTSTATTDENGTATLYFSPNDSGIAIISATTENGLSGSTQLTSTPSNSNDIRIRAVFYSGDLTHSLYHIHAQLVDADGNQITGLNYIDLATDFGQIAAGQSGPWDSNVTVTTDPWTGEANAYINITSSNDALVTAHWVEGRITRYSTFYLRVGPPPLITQPAFIFPESYAKSVDWYGNLIAAVGGSDISLWDTSTWSTIPLISRTTSDNYDYQCSGSECGITFSPDGQQVAFIVKNNRLYKAPINTLNAAWSQTVANGLKSYGDIDWKVDGSSIIANDVGITYLNSFIFRSSDGVITSRTPTRSEKVWSVRYSPNGNYLVETVKDRHFYLLNGTGSSNICTGNTWVVGDTANPTIGVTWAPNSNKYAVGYKDGTIHIYDVGQCSSYSSLDPSYYKQLNSQPFTIDWSPDGKYIVSGEDSNYLHIWEVQTGIEVATIQSGLSGTARSVSWSPDSQKLAIATGENIAIYTPLDNDPPVVRILNPINNAKTSNSSISVTGIITDNQIIKNATISINNGTPQSITINNDGSFQTNVDLQIGVTKITIDVTDGNQNFSNSTVSIERITDTDPPLISTPQINPISGNFCQLFTINAEIIDTWSGVDQSTITATIQQPDNQDIISLLMFDDGTQGDNVSGDGVFTTRWNSCSAIVEGTYYIDIEANDNSGNHALLDNAISLSIYDFPSISSVYYSPSLPIDQEPITVTANITDSSDIVFAQILYSINEEETYYPIAMHAITNTNQYQGVIPKQSSGELHFKIATSDAFGHISNSNIESLEIQDTTPPAVIYNFNVSADKIGSVYLNWISPGDDGNTGIASAYHIRYSNNPITTDSEWLSATEVVNPPIPLIAGSFQSMNVIGLPNDQQLFFAIRTEDEIPNFSQISISPSVIVFGPIQGLSAINDSPMDLGNTTTLTATISSGRNISYQWAFGDGELGIGAIITHTYSSVGEYTAVITASNIVTFVTATTQVIIDAPCYPLILHNTGQGDSPTPSLTNSNKCEIGYFHAGEVITFTPHPSTGYHLDHWEGTDSPSSNQLTMPAKSTTVIAHYISDIIPCYTLTTVINPTNGGTINSNPSPNCDGGKYLSGSQVQLTASPNSGYEFDYWSGAASGDNSSTSVTISEDKTIIANFIQRCYTLISNVNPINSGVVNASPSPNCMGVKYTSGTQVQLTEFPYTGYKFNSWSGALNSTNNPITITIDGNVTITANNDELPPSPQIINIIPSYAFAGDPAFVLIVNGSNFFNDSIVRWNDSNRVTTFISNTQLIANITSYDIASPGTGNVTVFNDVEGGSVSNSQFFRVYENFTVYTNTITTINPYIWADTYNLTIGDPDNNKTNEIFMGAGTDDQFTMIQKYFYSGNGWQSSNFVDKQFGFNTIAGISIADIDDDKKNEFVFGLHKVGNGDGGQIKYRKWNGSSWLENIIYTSTRDWAFIDSISDIDNDGINDIVSTLNETSIKPWLFKKNSDSWVKISITDASIDSSISSWVGDYDGDGLLELMRLKQDNQDSIYRNQLFSVIKKVNLSWVETDTCQISDKNFGILGGMSPGAVGDVDGDGKDEFITYNWRDENGNGISEAQDDSIVIILFDLNDGIWSCNNIARYAKPGLSWKQSITVGDLDNDFIDEVYIGREDGLINRYQYINSNWIEKQISLGLNISWNFSTIGDVDNNSINDLLLVGSSNDHSSFALMALSTNNDRLQKYIYLPIIIH